MLNTKLILKTSHFAAEKHVDQRRKNEKKSPYINHPIEVANLISEVGQVDDPVPLVAALLHDTVEDTDTTYKELVHQFGEDIANTVMEVTDDKSLPKVERKKLQVEHAKTVSNAAKLVKIADKISNVKSTVLDPPDWLTETKVGYGVWSKAVVDNMRGVNKHLEAEFDKWFEKLLEDNKVPLDSDFEKMLDSYYGSMVDSK